jgi:transposase
MNEQMKPNSYTNEFKASAVKLAIESDQPVTKTAEELGINKNTLHSWLSHYRRPQKPKTGQVEEEHLYDELKRLRKENKRLKEEREILKKAAAYFAKTSS